MFMIPLGIASGAPFTFMHFVTTNLIPVSLGNIVGGAVFCAAPYAFVFGGKSSSPKAA
jgi:formate/nitrite transporter FocA (FNT family)